MMTTLIAGFPALLALMTVGAQQPSDVLEQVRLKQQARWDTVQNYTVIQTIQGTEVPIYYERVDLGGQAAFRMVPQSEWERGRTNPIQQDPATFGREMARGLEMVGDAYVKETPGPFGSYVKSMTADMAFFASALQYAEDSLPEEDPAANARMAATFARRARLVGTEAVGERRAFKLLAEELGDIELEQANDGPRVSLRSVALWIDAEHHVPLRSLITSEVEGGGPFTLELLEQRYDQVGSLYEPTHRVMRISGMMEAMATDPKKKKEMAKLRKDAEKARAEMAKMEAQMAKLSPQQRRLPARTTSSVGGSSRTRCGATCSRCSAP